MNTLKSDIEDFIQSQSGAGVNYMGICAPVSGDVVYQLNFSLPDSKDISEMSITGDDVFIRFTPFPFAMKFRNNHILSVEMDKTTTLFEFVVPLPKGNNYKQGVMVSYVETETHYSQFEMITGNGIPIQVSDRGRLVTISNCEWFLRRIRKELESRNV